MPKNIIVPLDGSAIAERALPVAEALARQLGARLHLISVLEVLPAYQRRIEYYRATEPWKTWHQELEDYLTKSSAALVATPATSELLMGVDPATTIHERVREMEDPLLVIATRGRSGIRRLVLGSQTTRLVQLASYPLVVVPAECEGYPGSITRILVALDGSTFAEHACNVTLDLFGSDRPSLHLLRVVGPLFLTTSTYVDAQLRKELHDEARGYLAGVATELRARGQSTSHEVGEAYDVASHIVTIADVREVDLIALATHGRTGFSRLFLGSVADAVLRTATKPVFLVRPPEEIIAVAPEGRSRVL